MEKDTNELYPVICSLRTESFRATSGNYALQTQIYFLKSICKGSQDFIEEDMSSVGIEQVMSKIVNLYKVPDGRYRLMMIDIKYEFQEGYKTDYIYDCNYELIPYKPDEE